VPRAKQRTPALRDHVLKVALDVLVREGPAGFTTRKVAEGASTSTPAVYELFGDKAGLVRAVVFEGFRLLRRRLEAQPEREDPREELVRVVHAFRAFLLEQPKLAELMFMRRLADFDPGPAGEAAGAAVRTYLVGRVRRCIEAGVLAGDATDIAHVLVSMTQGLAATQLAGWLGTSAASEKRRWDLAVRALLDGLRPDVTAAGGAGTVRGRGRARRSRSSTPARRVSRRR
jgi:AcrR family transcriptional regulator